SIRKFRQDQLRREDLDLILEAAIWAPSGHNAQPWHFLVIQDKGKIDEMSTKTISIMADSPIEWVRKLAGREGYHLFHRAPTVIVVSGKRPGSDLLFPHADCSAAIQNMLLAAESLNIGSCWVGLTGFLFGIPEEVEALGIPEDCQPLYSVCFGYKDDSFVPPVPPRKEGKVTFYQARKS
ncbi:MAG: nitroreductase family protein, partial [Aminobacteriaceae bacterium]